MFVNFNDCNFQDSEYLDPPGAATLMHNDYLTATAGTLNTKQKKYLDSHDTTALIHDGYLTATDDTRNKKQKKSFRDDDNDSRHANVEQISTSMSPKREISVSSE